MNNLRQGYGILIWPDGLRYEGDFLKSDYHGKGIHTWPTG